MQSKKNKKKVSFLQKMLIYDGFNKKCHVIFKMFFSVFFFFFKLLSMSAKFQVKK